MHKVIVLLVKISVLKNGAFEVLLLEMTEYISARPSFSLSHTVLAVLI